MLLNRIFKSLIISTRHSEVLKAIPACSRVLSTTASDLGRTQWSYTRPRNTHMELHVPRRLRDGKFYRNQGKSGRGEDGRIKIRHKGGGAQRNWRIVDLIRVPSHQADSNVDSLAKINSITDRVLAIGYDPFRSANIALVAGNGSNQTRLILCPYETKIGDVITASRGKPASLARMIPGDAYPLEHLPISTMVHNIERVPGEGGQFCRAAGMYGTIIRKNPDGNVVLKCPGKNRPQLIVNKKCLATIGRVSNIDQKHRVIGKAGRSRWLNHKPKGQTGKDRWHHRKKVR